MQESSFKYLQKNPHQIILKSKHLLDVTLLKSLTGRDFGPQLCVFLHCRSCTPRKALGPSCTWPREMLQDKSPPNHTSGVTTATAHRGRLTEKPLNKIPESGFWTKTVKKLPVGIDSLGTRHLSSFWRVFIEEEGG